jgi:hypothetical protein
MTGTAIVTLRHYTINSSKRGKAIGRLVGLALAGLAAACLLSACSPHKFRLPVEEIRRPLSLPPKNWNVGLGLGPGHYFKEGPYGFGAGYYFQKGPLRNYIDGKFDFAYPYLPLSQRAELHFTPLNMKFYLLRNTRIMDSTIVCTGPNWALGGGVDWFSYSSVSGSSISFDLFTDFKVPFNEKIWMLSSCWMDYAPIDNLESDRENHDVDIVGGVGIGCQWNEHLYSTLVATEQYHRLQYSVAADGPPWMTTTTERFDEHMFNIYSYTGYNINKRWKIYVRPAVNFYSDGAISGSAICGFDYYW